MGTDVDTDWGKRKAKENFVPVQIEKGETTHNCLYVLTEVTDIFPPFILGYS